MRPLCLQATAAVMADLPAQFDTFKQQLLSDLEHQLLGNWGEQLKAAAAQETSQQVDAGLKVCVCVYVCVGWVGWGGGVSCVQ